MNHRVRRQFCRVHLDHLKMVIVQYECQLYDEGNYIAFIAWAFHIIDKVGCIHK